MRILILSTSDTTGGAAIAAYRLYHGLQKAGVDVWMLTQEKRREDSRIIRTKSLIPVKWRSKIDKFPLLFYPRRDKKALFSPSWLGLNNAFKWIQKINPDLIHFHWVCGGFFPFYWIKKIAQPIIWTLHDLWLFTGGCHLAINSRQNPWKTHKQQESIFVEQLLCPQFQYQCGKCPTLSSGYSYDLSRKIWLRKKRVFNQKAIYPIAISTWMRVLISKSSLLKNFPITHLPNPIDTNVFKPHPQEKARSLFQLPLNKRLIFFGALKPQEDPMKGFSYFIRALDYLPRLSDVTLVLTGIKSPESLPSLPFPTIALPPIQNEAQLIQLYNAVDVVVIPSVRENLSNMIMESLACGTPVVAFDIGGNSDMIEHLKNGYLAQPFDSKDLAHGIEWVLNHPDSEEIRTHARQKVLNSFDEKIVIPKYIQFYQHILEKDGLKR